MSPWTLEILAQYATELRANAPWIALRGAVGSGVFLAIFLLWRRARRAEGRDELGPREAGWLALGVALVVGVVLAVDRASLMDDAYITLRYARNLADGHGLVWNHGEWVEGYTNFLWTVMLAGASLLLPLELPLLAALGCLASYVVLVLALARAGSRLGGAAWLPPVAAILYALQDSAIEYATSGLETTFATLCVLLGLDTLLRGVEPRRAFLAGTWLILATFNRPDHGLFWAAGGLVVLVEGAWRTGAPLEALRRLQTWKAPVAFGASFALYAVYMVWKLSYYGDFLPNTYYAKSGDLTYFSQGGIYTLTFLLGAHLWVLLPISLAALVGPFRRPADRVLALFAVFALPVYCVYVAKVGGDFMYGRFYVVTLPVWLLLVEATLRRVADATSPRRLMGAAALAGLLGATVGGVRVIGPDMHRWYISNEREYYPVVAWYPTFEVDHDNWHAGRMLHEVLVERDLSIPVGTSGIGMLGYYSQLEVVDLRGLTDAYTAKLPLKERGMPGHEKWPDRAYLEGRGLAMIRTRGLSAHPSKWRGAAAVRFTKAPPGAPELEPKRIRHWYLYRYDAELVEALERQVPELRVKRFDREIDRWLEQAEDLPPEEVRSDVAFFMRYYFQTNADPKRLDAVETVARRVGERAAGR